MRQFSSLGKKASDHLLRWQRYINVWDEEFENQMVSYFKMSDINIWEFLESNEVPFVLGVEDQRKRGVEDLLDKSIRRIVETYYYMIPSLKIFVIALKGIGLFKNHSLDVKVQLEDPCDNHKFLIGQEVSKALLIERTDSKTDGTDRRMELKKRTLEDPKTFLLSSVQVEESKEASLESLKT
ncbi:hypothetical protein M9H77_13915 [Catharanthus roseus]|uniref:Uncharacterized protein n=1 Tax=Catharanthus roseus TaxID=4058 RepID=A0ACC0BLP1_CATRO|nr:hypothetical protein M9H77_13915 [Catharanthus roseus]